MEDNNIKELLLKHPVASKYKLDNSNKHSFFSGVAGSAKALILSAINAKKKSQILFIANDKDEAHYFHSDVLSILGNDKAVLIPSSYKRSAKYGQTDQENIVARFEALEKINDDKNPIIIVTYPEALVEKVVKSTTISDSKLNIKVGDRLSTDFVNEFLLEYKFERVDFVYEPGQFALRGSIIDVFSYAQDTPYRIDFFDDEVESIRTFDIETQISIEKKEKVSIVPNLQNESQELISIFDFIIDDTILAVSDANIIKDYIDDIYESVAEMEHKETLINSSNFLNAVDKHRVISFTRTLPSEHLKLKALEFNTSAQPTFNKDFEMLGMDIKNHQLKGYTVYVCSNNPNQIQRLRDIYSDIDMKVKFESSDKVVHQGFIDKDLAICYYTDHQIFGRYHRYKTKSNRDKHQAISMKELSMLHKGDYVVHVDHGVGQFMGLVSTEVNGRQQENIRLRYKDNDDLLVNIHSLHRISKYRGKEGTETKLNKLGTAAWQKMKDKTKKKVKDIAKELIALYAQRKEKKGFAYTADSYLQRELEASFIYEDTPDQYKSTLAVKKDMESSTPMDRLICGDVGFGKTEVAIRAAFKAACDGKQVAILVPTTILALQHFKTFSKRLEDFPVRIEYISRLRSVKEVKEVLKDLETGKIDILIGTHKIIGNAIKFNDLGLLIIDEEQKFGVSVKEKLKQLKVDVDVLTLTATPIPRTLQFSLMGARDLSVINTPPPNRVPIITEVHTFNPDIIREAIEHELSRNGQVFFINNRVGNILDVEKTVKELCPTAKTVVGHGQMEGNKLEKVMMDFVEGEYDVLIATTIIEAGLDIPNANTIIINNAQNFGLSELHQLRGRVGRENRRAFCYLLAPPLSTLPSDAQRRLKAIEEFSELGSGINIAMQDLDIRGAGNLLGGEQSGFIADIGYETYQQILNEAVEELKINEFSGLYEEEEQNQNTTYVTDCIIDTDLELRIPHEYISNTAERMWLYKRLDNIENTEKLEEFKSELTDRFGKLPSQVANLIEILKIRWLAMDIAIEKLVLKSGKLILYFIANPKSKFYESEHFTAIMSYIQTSKNCQLKENKGRLSIVFSSIDSIANTLEILSEIRSLS
ncbi:MAG: transcription-repair coupling factor [Bacteroidales bacterium]